MAAISFVISREDLLSPLQDVAGVIEARCTISILQNVLISVKDGMVTLTGSNIERQVSARSSISTDAAIAVTVPGKKLQQIVKAVPACSDIQFKIDEKKVLLVAGKSRFQLQTLPADDFPVLTVPAVGVVDFKISQKALYEVLSVTAISMASADIRYYLNGMLFELSNELLVTVGTDGHRLTVSETPEISEVCFQNSEAKPNFHSVILPRAAVLDLIRQLSATSEALVSVTITSLTARFSFGVVDSITKVIDGKFPNYHRVIPDQSSHRIVFDRKELVGALARAQVLVNAKTPVVKVGLSKNKLIVCCLNAEDEESYEELEISYDGPDFETGFNITYLMDVVHSVQDEELALAIEAKDSMRAVLFSSPSSYRWKSVIMPVRI